MKTKTTVSYTWTWGGQWAPLIATGIAIAALSFGWDLGWWWIGVVSLASVRVTRTA